MAEKSILSYLYSHNYNKIDPSNFVLPTTNDFKSTELPYELEKKIDYDGDFAKMLYFIEKPYSENPGFYSDDNIIIVKGKPILTGEYLGNFDSDTVYFPLSDIDDNNAMVSYNGNLFTIKEYLTYASASFGNNAQVGVRFVGINAPETYKYKLIEADKVDSIAKHFAKSDIKDSKENFLYDELSKDYISDTMYFIQKTIDGTKYWCQLTNESEEKFGPIEDENGNISYDTITVRKYLYKTADANDNRISHEMTQRMIDLIGDNEVVMMLDHNMLNNKSGDYPTTYDQYDDSLIGTLKRYIGGLYSENSGPKYAGFSNFGQDGYGRFLGCLYVKTKIPGLPEEIQEKIGDQWINVTKYLLYYYGPNGIINNALKLSFNSYSPTHVANYNFASSAFKVWTYNNNKQRVEDLLDNASFDSITRQREIQKQILGFDFDTELKDWTVMIGDYACIIPPTSIRCVTRNSAESVPLIRSRGSAMKETPQSERILEMTLYFTEDSGINGVEIEVPVTEDGETRRLDEHTLAPTGETIKYYMNGLRALISMFKLCPFMPITNTYINDTLNIDAVALSNLYISTVPGYPKCISANLQLREFNYHAYMTEIPYNGSESADTLMYSNLFEKCIDYDALRYYYQKPLYRGEVAARYPFDSQEYLNCTYGNKTALQPMSFEGSGIEFYIPDSDHLNRLLQVKMESISQPIKTQYKVTDDVKEWAAELGKLYPTIRDIFASDEYKLLYDFVVNGPLDQNGKYILTNTIADSSICVSYDVFVDKMSAGTNNDVNADVTYKYQLSLKNEYLRNMFSTHVCFYWNSPKTFLSQFEVYDIFYEMFDPIIQNNNSIIYSCSYSDGEFLFATSKQIETNSYNIINFLKNSSIDFDKNYSSYYNKDGYFVLPCFETRDNSETFFSNSNDLYKLIEYCFNYYSTDRPFELPSDTMQSTVMDIKEDVDLDTEDSFKFIKYPNDTIMDSAIVTNVSASFNNNLSNTYLKAIDGYAPQYLGGQDTVIELSLQTQDENVVSALNLLPKLCAEYMRNYRLILSCCPLRINTDITRMLGVNEVLIESVDVSTVDGYPGLYQVNMRFIAMDRTVRNKEALKRLDVNNAGSRTIATTQTFTTRDYFGLKDKISAAEIYPDLELPTIAELNAYGFTYIKYKIFDTSRIYPDPDFYFVYGATTTNKIIRDSIINNLENKNDKTFTISDYLGGQLNINIAQDGNEQLLSYNNENATARLEGSISQNIEDIVQNYKNAIYGLKLQTGNSIVRNNIESTIADLYGIKSLMDSCSIDDLYSFINVIGNLKSNEYWHFSSDAKGLYRSTLTWLSSEYDDFRNYYSQCNTVVDYINKDPFKLLYSNGTESYISNFYNNLLNDGQIPNNNDLIKKIYNKKDINELNNTFRNDLHDNIKSIFKNVFPINNCPLFFANAEAESADDKDKKIEKVVCSILSIADSLSGVISYHDIDDKKHNSWKLNAFTNIDDTIYPLINKQNLLLDIKDSLDSIVSFGPFKITQYSGKYIKRHFGLNYFESFLSDLLTERESHYSDTLKEKAYNKYIDDNNYYFLNPIIMKHQIDYYQNNNASAKRIIDGYKLGLLYDHKINASEIVINLTIIMQALICHDILISEIQCIAQNTDTILDKIRETNDQKKTETIYTNNDLTVFKAEPDKESKATVEKKCTKAIYDQLLEAQDAFETAKESMSEDEIKNAEKSIEDIASIAFNAQDDYNNIISSLKELCNKLILGNVLTTEVVFINGFNSPIMDIISSKNYQALNDILHSAQLALNSTNNIFTYKFLLALAGHEVIKSIEDLGASENTISSIATGIIDEKFKVNQESQPYIYTRDSFYDMITSDMRGRMARAFPTFYMLFVDEGREIGLWKLNDNFYNMSSISEITITKSRKIAADTCTISMTNLFKTFTTDDEDGKEMAYDLETLSSIDNSFGDLWDSIFSPRKLFLKEYQERLEQNPIERAQLKPGVRIHVRMGYGGDAYSLPTVFNGVVTQVSTGEYINIVCQGDGVELTNPINSGLKYSEDITNYGDIPIVKQIKNWATAGATPKTIMHGFLTTKGKWTRQLINKISSGRFFDDNPFGIAHFGDPDFKNIFNNSECVQNIYEAYSTPNFNGDSPNAVTYMQYDYATNDIPKVSTQIIDKSFWDLMHVMAGVAPDYIASIIPFGLRSSVFYGLPHYYCAYEYMKDSDGRIKERRKPFQQYHVYNSYSDIIENNISTSSEFMKTNAVGLYGLKGALGNMTTKRVGPIYADIDIYSEYQKSMTVDTTFVSQYNGALSPLGTIVPFLNNILEDTNALVKYGIDNESIAFRITARALKDSVKEMYQGELITIGDPSVKPYDVMYLSDVYENMQGGCEVEAVTHVLNSQTGFTSSIYVDPMIDIDNRYYQVAHSLGISTLASCVGVCLAVWTTSALFGRTTQPFTKMAAKLLTKGTDRLASSVTDILNFLPIGDKTSNKVASFIKGSNIFANLNATYQCDKIQELASSLAKIDLSKVTDLSKAGQLESYLDAINSMSKIDTSNLSDLVNLTKAKTDMQGKIYSEISKHLDDILKSQSSNVASSFNELADILKKSDGLHDLAKADANISDALTLLDNITSADFTNRRTVQKYIDAIKLLQGSDEAKDIASDLAQITKNIVDGTKTAATNIDNAASGLAASKIASAVSGTTDDVADALKKAYYVKTGTAIATSVGLTLAEMALEAIICGVVRNNITRFYRNLEVLRIYPLTKNGKVYTAGLSGSMGLVVGSSTFDKQGWLQNFLTDLSDNFLFKDIFYGIILGGDSRDISDITTAWRRGNKMKEPDSDLVGASSALISLLSSVNANMNNYDGMMVNRIALNRITNLYGNDSDTETAATLKAFSNLYISDGDTLEYDIRLSVLQPIDYLMDSLKESGVPDGTLTCYHTMTDYNEGTVQIHYNDNLLDVPYYHSIADQPDLVDMSMLSFDCNMILSNLIKYYIPSQFSGYTNSEGKPVSISIVNALVPGYSNSWLSTGYSTNFYINNMDHETFLMILDMEKQACNDMFTYDFVKQDDGNILYNISVYPEIISEG